MTLGLNIRPCASREGGDRLTEAEIDALDERGVDERAESGFTQTHRQLVTLTPEHARMRDDAVALIFASGELS